MTLIACCASVIAGVSAFAVVATAQQPEMDTAPIRSITVSGSRLAPPTVTGAPILYEQVIQRTEKVYLIERIRRDVDGRMRIERPAVQRQPGRPSTDPPIIVEIYDPVLGFLYTLDESRRIAHRTKVISGQSRALEQPVIMPDGAVTRIDDVASSSASTRRRDLGIDTINGLQAEGRREIKAFSNGASVVTETWTSPELNVVLLFKRLEMPSQEAMMLINLSPYPPGASIFSVPKGYAIIDETGPFTIEFGK